MKAPLSQVQMRPAAGIDTFRRVSYYILRQDAMSARGTEMKSCYLIRHGKPDFPGGERMCLGRTDLPLSAVGRMEAALLAEYFPRRDAVLFSSPLRRAAETAAQFARPVSVLPGLAEMDAGEWDGLSFTEIRSRWPELYARRAHERVPPPGGESEAAALGRFTAAMGEVLKPGGGACAVTHSGVVALYLESLGEERIKIPYGSYVELAVEGERALEASPPVLPRPEPDERLCLLLLRAAGTPRRAVEHSRAVAQLAAGLAGRLGLDADKALCAGLLHDIARGEPDHAGLGAAWLDELGYGGLAGCVALHNDHAGETLDAAAAVFLADKLFIGTQRCTLEQRFEASARKIDTPEGARAMERRYAAALNLKKLAAGKGVII